MKKTVLMLIFLPLLLLLIPLPALELTPQQSLPTSGKHTYEDDRNVPVSQAATDKFLVYNHKTNEINELSAENYIFCVLAAEMPASYEIEALKAQAVAAYTFACRRKQTSSNKNYDISTDYTVDQAYISEAEARENWGEKADEYTEKLKKAVAETLGYIITYQGNTALSVYHSVSAGKTEKAVNVWGSEIPYLIAVNSSADCLADNYISSLEFSSQDFSEKLKDLCTFSGGPETWVGKNVCTESGYVKEISICQTQLSGADVRSALKLASSAFDITFKDDVFTVTCRGYGHGVGMSQHGANIMAQQGSSFKEILSHYYSGCDIEKIK